MPDREEVPEEATPLDQDEFVEYVAERAGVDRERAYDYVESVFGGMADVAPEEFDRAATQFSPDYERLLVDVDIEVSLE
ncbi:DUF2267 domain-containing protein [Halospeciosus flavus]|uniref:DUF2267 domain-containing protein n=1 Tax=Halospeciosus flavus TaxID=3032283 RepID=UPI003623E3FB